MQISSHRALRLTFLLVSGALTLPAQTAPPTPKPSPDVVAGIPVNYDDGEGRDILTARPTPPD